MTKGTVTMRLGLAFVLLAGAVVAGVAGVRVLARSVSDGQIGSLVIGLALGAAALAAVAISSWLILLQLQGDGPSSASVFSRAAALFSVFSS